MGEIRYLISDAAKQVDVETHVLRYWEEELCLPIPRNEMGHRYYTDFHIRLFCQIKELKEKGYQLKAIKHALEQVMLKQEEVKEAANLLDEDAKAGVIRISDYSEPVQEQCIELISPGMKEKDGQDEMKRRKEHKKVTAWERRTGAPRSMAEAKIAEVKVKELKAQETKVQELKVREIKTEQAQADQELNKEELVVAKSKAGAPAISDEKMEKFQEIMNHVIGQALEVNAQRLGEEIGRQVNQKLTEEFEDMVKMRDEKEEERFRQIDELIRICQRENQGKAEAAATKMPFFRRRKAPKSI